MFPERLLCQISRSNTNEAFPPTMQPVFCLSTRTEDMTSTFGKGRPLTKKKNHWFDWHTNLSGGDDFPHCFNCFDFLSCGKRNTLIWMDLAINSFCCLPLWSQVAFIFRIALCPKCGFCHGMAMNNPWETVRFLCMKILCKNGYGICHLCLCSYVSRVFSGRGQLRDFCQRHCLRSLGGVPCINTVLLCWLVFRTQDQPPKIYRRLLKIDF